MSQEVVDAVRRNLEAWHEADVDAWLETAHPEAEWVSEIARRVEDPDLVYLEVEEIRDLGDTALALGRVRALGRARAYLDQQQALDAVRHSKRVP